MLHPHHTPNTAQGYIGPKQAIPPKPATLALNLAGIPTELRTRDQWVCWRWEHRPDPKGGKWTKIPVNPLTGANAAADDPRTWAAYSVAVYWWQQHRETVAGVGFVFSEHDPFTGIDLDHARDPETKKLTPEAQAIVDRFDSFTEWSISGTGAHIIIRAELPPNRNRTGGIELYDRGRFFVMSGRVIQNPHLIGDRQDELEAFHRELFPSVYAPKPEPRPLSTEPLSINDDELLRRCQGNKKFSRLAAGDNSDYGDDTSVGDLAYIDIIARNGGERSQADAIYRASGRYRDKWDQKRGAKTYGEMTIDKGYDGTVIPFSPGPRLTANGHARLKPQDAGLLPDDLPDDVASLKAIIIDLRTRALTAETRVGELELELAETRLEISTIIATTTHPHLKAEAPTLIRTAIDVREAKKRGQVDERGFAPISTARIGDDYPDRADGLDAPIRSRSTVNRHLKKAAALGLIEREVRKVQVRRVVRDKDNKPIIDPETRQPKTYDASGEQTWVKLTGESITDMLRPVAFFRAPETMPGEPPKIKPHGGDRRSEAARAEQAARRTACPDCGSTSRRTYCVGCAVDITELADADDLRLIAESKRIARMVDAQSRAPAFQDDPLKNRGLTPRYQDETGGYYRPPTPRDVQQGLAVYAGQHRQQAPFQDDPGVPF